MKDKRSKSNLFFKKRIAYYERCGKTDSLHDDTCTTKTVHTTGM